MCTRSQTRRNFSEIPGNIHTYSDFLSLKKKVLRSPIVKPYNERCEELQQIALLNYRIFFNKEWVYEEGVVLEDVLWDAARAFLRVSLLVEDINPVWKEYAHPVFLCFLPGLLETQPNFTFDIFHDYEYDISHLFFLSRARGYEFANFIVNQMRLQLSNI